MNFYQNMNAVQWSFGFRQVLNFYWHLLYWRAWVKVIFVWLRINISAMSSEYTINIWRKPGCHLVILHYPGPVLTLSLHSDDQSNNGRVTWQKTCQPNIEFHILNRLNSNIKLTWGSLIKYTFIHWYNTVCIWSWDDKKIQQSFRIKVFSFQSWKQL